MVFSSLPFLCVFLPAVFLLYCLIPSFMVRNGLLILASLLFYAYGEPVYVLLMLVSTVLNYALARGMGAPTASAAPATPAEDRVGKRRLFLVLACLVNLGILVVFKYTDMLVSTLNAFLSTSIPLPGVKLPIGISFFTFQALSYCIDVYRGQVEAQRSYPKVLLYISFFPQLIAGPIVKYHDIEPQLSQRDLSWDQVALGLRRFCVGLGKKVLIANQMALVADSLYSAPLADLSAPAAWLAAFAYLFQIYFDFSGYSDMAIGLGRIFGFTFKENFNYPYSSRSIKEFWRRWHISLSTWFKEYLYIPLGGNRKGRPRAVLNKVIVFFLCGLWHGAAWTFVIWGLFHGLLLLMEEYLPVKKLPRALGHVYCILMVTIAFVIFRADSLGLALQMLGAMFGHWSFASLSLGYFTEQLSPLFVITFLVAIVAALPVKDVLAKRLEQSSDQVRAAAYVLSYVAALLVLVLCILALSSGGYNPFIYFRF